MNERKDAFGNELNVGDIVVFFYKEWTVSNSHLKKGIIKHFSTLGATMEHKGHNDIIRTSNVSFNKIMKL